jgi:hypothetical protein
LNSWKPERRFEYSGTVGEAALVAVPHAELQLPSFGLRRDLRLLAIIIATRGYKGTITYSILKKEPLTSGPPYLDPDVQLPECLQK